MTIEIWQLFLLTGVGVVAGWMNVMAGGGSMLTVPVMLFLGIPGPVANGTNRIAILAQNITAVTTFFRSGHSDFRLSVSLALAALPGAIAGAMVGVHLAGPWFERTLAVIMIIVLLLMRVKPKITATQSEAGSAPTRARLIWGHLLMLVAGFWGGFIQIGVGFILMPILYRVLGLDLVRVNMHKVFIVLVYTIAALAIFASQLQLFWLVGLALGLGNAIGGWLGARTSTLKGESWIRPVMYGLVIVFIIKLLFF